MQAEIPNTKPLQNAMLLHSWGAFLTAENPAYLEKI